MYSDFALLILSCLFQFQANKIAYYNAKEDVSIIYFARILSVW